MLTVARQKAGLVSPPEFRVGDAAVPPVAAGSVEAIVSRHLLWTLPDPLGALTNWHRALRPGGRLIVIDGLWALGADPDAAPPADDPYTTYYTPDVQAQLPLLGARSLDRVFALIAQAGFVAPQTLPPEALARLDSAAHGGGHEHPGRFIVAAERGG
jgi:SAM-dependent methyltransferase